MWVLAITTLVMMDGANWLAHVADHGIGPLWRMHALHHSQEELTVFTSFRAHPLSHVMGFFLAAIPVALLMGERPLAPVLITIYVCLGTMPHANVSWSLGPVGKVVVAPAYHRLHHSNAEGPVTNFGIVLTIWDVAARRAQFPRSGEAPCATGIAGRPLAIEQTQPACSHLALLCAQILEPFGSSGAPRPATDHPRRLQAPGL